MCIDNQDVFDNNFKSIDIDKMLYRMKVRYLGYSRVRREKLYRAKDGANYFSLAKNQRTRKRFCPCAMIRK